MWDLCKLMKIDYYFDYCIIYNNYNIKQAKRYGTNPIKPK